MELIHFRRSAQRDELRLLFLRRSAYLQRPGANAKLKRLFLLGGGLPRSARQAIERASPDWRFKGWQSLTSVRDPGLGAIFGMQVIHNDRRLQVRIEKWLTYGAIFLSPLIHIRTEFFYFTLSDAFYIMAFGAMLVRGSLPRDPLHILTWTWFSAYVLIVTGLHVSSLANGDAMRGLILTLQYSFCFLLLPFVLLRSNPAECYRLLIIFASGVSLLDLHGIITFFTVGYVPGAVTVTGNLRLATLFGNPNGAANLNAITIVLLVWLWSDRKIPGALAFVYLGITGLALILTSSNTGLIAVSVGLLAYTVLTFRLKSALQVLGIVAIPIVFFSLFGVEHLPATFQKRVLTAVVAGDVQEAGTFVHRFDLIREAIDIIERQKILLLGMGADQFRKISVQEAPVHNVFLILWAEGGIFSLLGWLVLLASGFVLWVRARTQRIMRHGRAAVLAAFCVFVVVSGASAHIYARYWYTILLLIMAPTIAAVRQAERTNFLRSGCAPRSSWRSLRGEGAR